MVLNQFKVMHTICTLQIYLFACVWNTVSMYWCSLVISNVTYMLYDNMQKVLFWAALGCFVVVAIGHFVFHLPIHG